MFQTQCILCTFCFLSRSVCHCNKTLCVLAEANLCSAVFQIVCRKIDRNACRCGFFNNKKREVYCYGNTLTTDIQLTPNTHKTNHNLWKMTYKRCVYKLRSVFQKGTTKNLWNNKMMNVQVNRRNWTSSHWIMDERDKYDSKWEEKNSENKMKKNYTRIFQWNGNKTGREISRNKKTRELMTKTTASTMLWRWWWRRHTSQNYCRSLLNMTLNEWIYNM